MAAAVGYVAVVGKARAWDGVPDGRRRVMQANKSKGTKPELVLRRLLHSLGYRFRLHRRSLPGTPDLVFPSRRAAIQVHGCFWHQHEGCPKAHLPRTRQDYWIPKLRRNVERDKDSVARLEAVEWRTLTVWECELAHPAAVAARAADFLGLPGPGRQGHAGKGYREMAVTHAEVDARMDTTQNPREIESTERE